MKYRILLIHNLSDLRREAPDEFGHAPRTLSRINALLQELSPESGLANRSTVEQFLLSGGTLAILTCDCRIVGMACLVIRSLINRNAATIEDVVIAKEHRGKGHSRRMLKKLIAWARLYGVDHIDLASRPGRRAANRLCASLGFVRQKAGVYRFTLC